MRAGIIPVILGSAVTTTGAIIRGKVMKRHGMTKRDASVALGAGLLGLGAAHILLGTINFISDKN